MDEVLSPSSSSPQSSSSSSPSGEPEVGVGEGVREEGEEVREGIEEVREGIEELREGREEMGRVGEEVGKLWGEMRELREIRGSTEREERPKFNSGENVEVLVGSTPELGTEVGSPGFGDPRQVSTVLVTVMVFVFVLVRVTYLGPLLRGGGWTSPKMQVVMDITHRELSCARATAARKRVRKAA